MTFKVGTVARASSADSTPAPVPRGRRAQARYEEEKRRQKEAVEMLEVIFAESNSFFFTLSMFLFLQNKLYIFLFLPPFYCFTKLQK